MQSLFKQENGSKFSVKNGLAFKNLRLVQKFEFPHELLIDNQAEEAQARARRSEHQILLTTLQNRVVLLHANPFLGRVYIYELDPSNAYRYQQQISFAPGCLIRLQICDSMIALHNIDEKCSQLYDLKIADYALPLLRPNLEVDQRHVSSKFLSDAIFAEEFLQRNEAGPEFKISFSPEVAQGTKTQDVSVYQDTVIYIAPFFMVHPVHFRCLSTKLSLESLIANSREMNLLLLSMINRQNNKKILVKLAN